MNDASPSVPAPRRKPWIAGLLAFLWPGVGYFYAGRGWLGLLLLLLFPMINNGLRLLAVLIPVPVLCVAVPAILSVGLHLVVVLGAARAASKFPAARRVPSYARWYFCLIAVVPTGVQALLWAEVYRTFFVEAFRIPAGSMEPALQIGDHVFVVKWAYGWREPVSGRLLSSLKPPGRGDLMVFRYPEDPSRAFIKRCIGLPGETVEIRRRVVFVDGKPLDEPYVQFLVDSDDLDDPDHADLANWGPETIPSGQYFVLGDNRDNSKDSRYWGYVPEDHLLGRCAVIYWSYAATREEYFETDASRWLKGIASMPARARWDRVGRRLH